MKNSTSIPADEHLITALDLPDRALAMDIVETCGETIKFYKIGYQLIYKDSGITLAKDLIAAGKKLFLDVKLHDIPNTVTQGVEGIADMGVDFATVHAEPATMEAAVRGRSGSNLKILAVTVMTSLDDEDLKQAGYRYGAQELVMRRAQQAADIGVDGLICSAHEAPKLREKFGDQLILVTPGVRPSFANHDDQKRVTTPAQAIKNGADHMVVGRPIIAHDDPARAANLIQKEIAQSLLAG